jgi:hypothetical protein
MGGNEACFQEQINPQGRAETADGCQMPLVGQDTYDGRTTWEM